MFLERGDFINFVSTFSNPLIVLKATDICRWHSPFFSFFFDYIIPQNGITTKKTNFDREIRQF